MMTTILPNYVFSILSGNDVPDTKWSKSTPPPAMGDAVTVTMNGLGEGVVIGYEVVGGWLGLHVRLSNPPEWWLKQNARWNRNTEDGALVFGAEIK